MFRKIIRRRINKLGQNTASRRYQKGQSMLEVAIALTIASVVIVALLTTVLGSLDSAQFSKNQNQATQYSQRGMEAIRTISGTYVNPVYNNNPYCLDSSQKSPILTQPDSNCDEDSPNLDGKFIHKVTFNHSGTAECGVFTKVIVATYWTDGKCEDGEFCHKSEITSCATNL